MGDFLSRKLTGPIIYVYDALRNLETMLARLAVLALLAACPSHALVAWMSHTVGPCAADMRDILCVCFETQPFAEELQVRIGSSMVATPPRVAVAVSTQGGRPASAGVSAFLDGTWTAGVTVSFTTPFLGASSMPPYNSTTLRAPGSDLPAPYQTVTVVYNATITAPPSRTWLSSNETAAASALAAALPRGAYSQPYSIPSYSYNTTASWPSQATPTRASVPRRFIQMPLFNSSIEDVVYKTVEALAPWGPAYAAIYGRNATQSGRAPVKPLVSYKYSPEAATTADAFAAMQLGYDNTTGDAQCGCGTLLRPGTQNKNYTWLDTFEVTLMLPLDPTAFGAPFPEYGAMCFDRPVVYRIGGVAYPYGVDTALTGSAVGDGGAFGFLQESIVYNGSTCWASDRSVTQGRDADGNYCLQRSDTQSGFDASGHEPPDMITSSRVMSRNIASRIAVYSVTPAALNTLLSVVTPLARSVFVGAPPPPSQAAPPLPPPPLPVQALPAPPPPVLLPPPSVSPVVPALPAVPLPQPPYPPPPQPPAPPTPPPENDPRIYPKTVVTPVVTMRMDTPTGEAPAQAAWVVAVIVLEGAAIIVATITVGVMVHRRLTRGQRW